MFDPPTKAHLDLLLTAKRVFPVIDVLVANNAAKKPWFTLAERVEMFQDIFKIMPDQEESIRIVPVDNEYVPMKIKYASFVIRGLRNGIDFGYETELMRLYRMMNYRLEPIYFPSLPENNMDLISSSMVKSLVGPPGWEEMVANFLPVSVVPKFIARAKTVVLGQPKT